MARWRKKLFLAIARNAANPVELLRPARRPHGRHGLAHHVLSSVPRVLILTADIGAGHDLPAALLAEGIRLATDAEVAVVDGLQRVGPSVGRSLVAGAETVLERAPVDVRRPVLADRELFGRTRGMAGRWRWRWAARAAGARSPPRGRT